MRALFSAVPASVAQEPVSGRESAAEVAPSVLCPRGAGSGVMGWV